MGMRHFAYRGWIVPRSLIEELCPNEWRNFIDAIGSIHSCEGCDTEDEIEIELLSQWVCNQDDMCVEWHELREAFLAATLCDGEGLCLGAEEFDTNEGEGEDWEEPCIFTVEGMTKLTPAGEKFSKRINEQQWTSFG